MDELPDNVKKLVAEAKGTLIPQKSKNRYELCYSQFTEWQCLNQLQGNITEEVILAYLASQGKRLAPTSLWSYYSMLKNMLKIKDNIDIGKFHTVINFLKNQSKGYKPKKAFVFTEEQVYEFLETAPDETFLAAKVTKQKKKVIYLCFKKFF